MIPIYMANNRYDLAKELVTSYPVDRTSSYSVIFISKYAY